MLTGQGGLPMARVETPVSTGEIYLQGAHVTHFQSKGEAPLLFLSRESKFTAGAAIRGGVPVIFPWFGAKDGAPAHGFARINAWDLVGAEMVPTGETILRFKLPGTVDPSGAEWMLEYIVSVGETLGLELVATNSSGQKDFTFENCLHTYFLVGDINSTSVIGLKGVKYRDKVENFAEKTEANPTIRISGEVDRVYTDTTATVEMRDDKLRRRILVEKAGSASTVVWNPWIAKSKQMSDFGDEEYLQMVCVESGNVGKNWITLKPGESSRLKVKLASARL